jgi:hypothetical protein
MGGKLNSNCNFFPESSNRRYVVILAPLGDYVLTREEIPELAIVLEQSLEATSSTRGLLVLLRKGKEDRLFYEFFRPR